MGEKTHIVQVKSLHQRRRRYAAVFAVCEPAVAVWVVCVCGFVFTHIRHQSDARQDWRKTMHQDISWYAAGDTGGYILWSLFKRKNVP